MDKKALWMLLAQNGSGSGGGSSDDIYPVIITKNGTEYTADKTGREIYSAIGAGKYVVGIYGSSQITADVKRQYSFNSTKQLHQAHFSFVTGKTVTQITVKTEKAGDELTESVTAATYTLAEDADKLDVPAVAGTAGQVLTLDSNLDPVWDDAAGGGAGDTVLTVPIQSAGSKYTTTVDTDAFMDAVENQKPMRIIVPGFYPFFESIYTEYSASVDTHQSTGQKRGTWTATFYDYSIKYKSFAYWKVVCEKTNYDSTPTFTITSHFVGQVLLPSSLGTAGQVLTSAGSSSQPVWADAPGLPSTESATEGQVLVLDSNLDPVWDAVPGGQFPVSVVYADDGYGNLTISSVDKTYTDISDAIHSGQEVILTLEDATSVTGVDIDDPNYEGTGTTTTQIVSTVHTVGDDGVLYLTGLTSLIATTFSIDGNGNAGLYITSLVSGKDVTPLYGYIDTNEGQPTMDITAMDIYDAANAGRKLIIRQIDGNNGFYFYDVDYMTYDDTINAYTVIMRARIDDRTVRTCTAIYDNANAESTISLTTTRYATA